jgi:hypothetical protein
MKQPIRLWYMPGAVLLAALVMACSTARYRADYPQDAAESPGHERIAALVERLYLESKELKTIYLDLRAISTTHAFLPDDLQLSYLQKSALYVEKAHLSAHYQWELFAIMNAIRPSSVMDYYTLRHQSLGQAANQARYDRRFLEVYRPFISSEEAQEEIRRALAAIDKIQALYTELMAAIAPLVRKGPPTAI